MPLRQRRDVCDSSVTVWLAAGAAGPIGGDNLQLHVDVGPGASLCMRHVAASLALPGPRGEPSQMKVVINVAADGTLAWLPEPLIAAHGCDHRTSTQVTLERGARLFLREELLLGRHAEQSGSVRQRLRVTIEGHPLHDQDLRIDPREAACCLPVTGGRRAIGSLLVVDPAMEAQWNPASAAVVDTDTAVMPLGGPAVLISAVADDALDLRRRLATGLEALDGSALAPRRVPRAAV